MTLSCKASGQPPLKATPRSLPPELILAVLHFAVPFCTFDDFASRSASLRAFSLVSSAWRIAQLELFAHPVLPTAESARLLRVAIAGAGGRGEGLAEAVRTLRVGDERRALHYGLVADLLPLLTNLEEVWLLNVDAVVLEDLAGNANLHSLYCYRCGFPPLDARRAQLPTAELALCRLAIDTCRVPAIMPATSLPHLHTILVHPILGTSQKEVHRPLSQFVADLAPRLDALSFTIATYVYLHLSLPSFSRLSFCEVFTGGPWTSVTPPSVLAAMPSLQALRLTRRVDLDQLATYLEQNRQHRLERLHIPLESDVGQVDRFKARHPDVEVRLDPALDARLIESKFEPAFWALATEIEDIENSDGLGGAEEGSQGDG